MTRYARPDDWTRHRVRLCHLYEKHSIPTMKRIMEAEHGFVATKKMYRYHLSLWGRDKNRKATEMTAIAAKAHRRRAENKESTFYVRGKLMPLQSIVEYWERRGLSIHEVASMRRTTSTPDTIRCITPPLSSSLTMPCSLERPEQVFRSITSYIRGSFDANTWLWETEHQYPINYGSADSATKARHGRYMDDLHNQTMLACALFAKHRPEDAGACLSTGFEGVKELAQFGYPPLLDRLPRTLLAIMVDNQSPDIAFAILRQFAAFTKLFHGSLHPFYHFCSALAALDVTTLIDVLHVAVGTIRDGFEHALGPFHRTTLAARYTYIRTVLASQGFEAEAAGFREVVRQCELFLPERDLRTVKARTDLTLFLKREKRYEEGKIQAQQIILDTRHGLLGSQMNDRVAKLCARGYSCLAGCEYGLGRTEEAIVQKKIVIAIFRGLGSEHTAHIAEETFWLNEWRKEMELAGKGESSS